MIIKEIKNRDDGTETRWKTKGVDESTHLVPVGDAPPDPQFFDISQVAKMFNRSARTVRWWIAQGRLRPVRIGRALFIPASEIARLTEDEQY